MDDSFISGFDDSEDSELLPLFQRIKKAIYNSAKYRECEDLMESFWYYIDQIENDPATDNDTAKWYKNRMNR